MLDESVFIDSCPVPMMGDSEIMFRIGQASVNCSGSYLSQPVERALPFPRIRKALRMPLSETVEIWLCPIEEALYDDSL